VPWLSRLITLVSFAYMPNTHARHLAMPSRQDRPTRRRCTCKSS
jgi:hypothetical protein